MRDAVYLRHPPACVEVAAWHAACVVERMQFDDPFASPMPSLLDRGQVADADALIASFGDDAGFEAAARADRSRGLGNVVDFARWRQIERLIVLLSGKDVVGTIH